jgi:membrane protein implicated in regulation of membrane protease activity
MTWWIWVLLGLVLLAAEMATPGGFFTIFFGLAAVLVGVLVKLNLAGDASMQWLLFTGLSILGVLVFRKPVMRALKLDVLPKKAVDTIAGEEALVLEDVAPGTPGKAELRGASWTARTEGAETLVKGRRCKVDRIDGLTLWLKA